jgi:chemotaxis protein methyltransferase CheR
LAVPETFFWRQSEQSDALAQVVAPEFFAAHPDRPLRIWSAACCTGEEPLTIAMALDEAGLLDEYRVEIVATDGSSALVDRARQRSYSARSFRQLPEALKAKYFEPDGDRWRPIERLSRRIHWNVANLTRAAEIERYATSDVIFCRNVFIYFSDDAIRRVIHSFSNHMPRDGYVFLGASESLTRLAVDLELAQVGSAFAYVKEGRRQLVERERRSIADASAAQRAVP